MSKILNKLRLSSIKKAEIKKYIWYAIGEIVLIWLFMILCGV